MPGPREHDDLWGIHAAAAWVAAAELSFASPGYHFSKRGRSVPSRARVRICSSRGVVQKVLFPDYTGNRQSRASQGIPRFECNPDLNHAVYCRLTPKLATVPKHCPT